LELADDADLRIRAPKNFLKAELDESRTIETRAAPADDPRLPTPGSMLVRRYRGKDIVVRVREDGFEYDSQVHRSLSSAVRAATGSGTGFSKHLKKLFGWVYPGGCLRSVRTSSGTPP